MQPNMEKAANPTPNPHVWNGWFPITHEINGVLPASMDERFLVWIPAVSDEWSGETHIAWVDGDGIAGEWRYVAEIPGINEGLNAMQPTHWQLLPGEPTGLAD